MRVSQTLVLWHFCCDHSLKAKTNEVTSRILATLSKGEGLTLDFIGSAKSPRRSGMKAQEGSRAIVRLQT